MNGDDDKIYEIALAAAKKLARGLHLNEWFEVGNGFCIGVRYALRIAGNVNDRAESKVYQNAFGAWGREHPKLWNAFKKGPRNDAIWLSEHKAEVEAFLADIGRTDLNHPTTVRRAWEKKYFPREPKGKTEPKAGITKSEHIALIAELNKFKTASLTLVAMIKEKFDPSFEMTYPEPVAVDDDDEPIEVEPVAAPVKPAKPPKRTGGKKTPLDAGVFTEEDLAVALANKKAAEARAALKTAQPVDPAPVVETVEEPVPVEPVVEPVAAADPAPEPAKKPKGQQADMTLADHVLKYLKPDQIAWLEAGETEASKSLKVKFARNAKSTSQDTHNRLMAAFSVAWRDRTITEPAPAPEPVSVEPKPTAPVYDANERLSNNDAINERAHREYAEKIKTAAWGVFMAAQKVASDAFNDKVKAGTATDADHAAMVASIETAKATYEATQHSFAP